MQARLRDAREKAGLSQRGLSVLVGVAPGTVGNIESGHVESPSADVLAALAGALGTTVDFLALGNGDPPPYETVRAALAVATVAAEDRKRRQGTADTEPDLTCVSDVGAR